MPRRRVKIHTDTIELWHIDDYDPKSRLGKLIRALAAEEEFNDPYAYSVVTDDTTLLSYSIGFS